jgi:hypothetical protein
MGQTGKIALGALATALILTACGSAGASATTNATASPASTTKPSSAPTPVAAVTMAELESLANQLYPNTNDGRQTCFTGDATVPQCPVTSRLRAGIEAQQAQDTGGGADPICGCQNIDPGMSFTYTVDSSGGGGVIHMNSFDGSTRVDIVVIPQNGTFLADDIRYCTNTPPSSVYPNETVSC